MAHFVLFYVTGPGERPPERSEQELHAVLGRYAARGDGLRARGRLAGGARLTSVWSDPGRVCSGSGAKFLVTDGPLAEAKEVIGGYGVVEAADYDEAVSLCRDHPHLAEGHIVIRRLA
jgi:hypothetical protein